MARSKSAPPAAPAAAPPEGYSPAARRLWEFAVGEFELEEHGRAVLAAACAELTRADELDGIVAQEGAVILDRFHQPKPHPAVAAARSSRLAASRLIRALNLDPPEANPGPGRYPRGIRR